MSEFSISKIIPHRFHVDNNECESGIGYDMMIGCELVVKLVIPDKYKFRVIQWNCVTVPIKEPSDIICQIDITSRDMIEVLMQTPEPFSTRKSNKRLAKVLNGAYAKSYLK